MARVFVTGSADALGKMAAELLIEQGHKVVLHARSDARADETRKKIAGAEDIVVGDLASVAETKSAADARSTSSEASMPSSTTPVSATESRSW
jgi:NAD(P)-dependent dehydrogenase (short-subunit alcohol dehydrogenase family)